MNISTVIIIVLLAATVIALISGIVLMMRGGEANRKYGNKMMVLRVSFQGLIVLMLGAMFLLGKQ